MASAVTETVYAVLMGVAVSMIIFNLATAKARYEAAKHELSRRKNIRKHRVA